MSLIEAAVIGHRRILRIDAAKLELRLIQPNSRWRAIAQVSGVQVISTGGTGGRHKALGRNQLMGGHSSNCEANCQQQYVIEASSIHSINSRSEERRVGKECRDRWSTKDEKQNDKQTMTCVDNECL